MKRLILLVLLTMTSFARAGNFLSPDLLPSLVTYRGKVLLGLEIEVKQEGFAKVVQYFNIPGVRADLPDDLRAAKVLSNLGLLARMTLKRTAPEALRKALRDIEWIDGGECVEFRHKHPTDNPLEYMKVVDVLADYLGVREKIANPLDRFIPGPWFTYHTHMSVSERGRDLKNVATALNVLKAIEYAEIGRAEYAIAGDFSTFTTEIDDKGQMRLVENNRIEMRRQTYDPARELRRNLYVMSIADEDAFHLVCAEIARRFTPQVVQSFLSVTDKSVTDFFEESLMLTTENPHEKLNPQSLKLIFDFYRDETMPSWLYPHYSSMFREDQRRLRLRALDILTSEDPAMEFEVDSRFLSQSFADFGVKGRERIALAIVNAGGDDLVSHFLTNVLPLDPKLLEKLQAKFTERLNPPATVFHRIVTPATNDGERRTCGAIFKKVAFRAMVTGLLGVGVFTAGQGISIVYSAIQRSKAADIASSTPYQLKYAEGMNAELIAMIGPTLDAATVPASDQTAIDFLVPVPYLGFDVHVFADSEQRVANIVSLVPHWENLPLVWGAAELPAEVVQWIDDEGVRGLLSTTDLQQPTHALPATFVSHYGDYAVEFVPEISGGRQQLRIVTVTKNPTPEPD